MAKSKRKSNASLLAAQASFFNENNIVIERKAKHGGVDTPPKRNLLTIDYKNLGLNGDLKDFSIYIRGINKAPKLINMSDEEVIRLIIKNYEEAYAYITRHELLENPLGMQHYLSSMCMNFGVCNFSRNKLGVSLSGRKWIDSNGTMYWCLPPFMLYTPDEIILSISLRIKKLKEILENKLYE